MARSGCGLIGLCYVVASAEDMALRGRNQSAVRPLGSIGGLIGYGL